MISAAHERAAHATRSSACARSGASLVRITIRSDGEVRARASRAPQRPRSQESSGLFERRRSSTTTRQPHVRSLPRRRAGLPRQRLRTPLAPARANGAKRRELAAGALWQFAPLARRQPVARTLSRVRRVDASTRCALYRRRISACSAAVCQMALTLCSVDTTEQDLIVRGPSKQRVRPPARDRSRARALGQSPQGASSPCAPQPASSAQCPVGSVTDRDA